MLEGEAANDLVHVRPQGGAPDGDQLEAHIEDGDLLHPRG